MATVDTSIYGNYLRPPKSIQEYQTEAATAETNQLGLQGARINLIGQQQAQADEQALRELYKQPDFNPQSAEGIAKLYRVNPKAGAAAQAAQLAAQKTQAEIGHLGAQTTQAKSAAADSDAKVAGARLKQYRDTLDFVDTPQGAARWLKAQYDDPITAPQMAGLGSFEQAVTRIPQDPQGFQQWRQQAVLGMEKHITAMQTAKRDAATAQHQQNQDRTAAGNLSVAQANLEQGKTPAGYRRAASGNLEFIPGGPADPEQINNKATAKPLAAAAQKQLTEARDNAATIDRLTISFKPGFASKGVLGIGANESLAAKGVLGTDKDSVDWWKNYRKQAELVERHALFGAALTPNEQASWQSADISPGMDAAVIKRNLATRQALTKKIFENTQQDLIDAGHSEARVRAIGGRNTKIGGEDIHSQADAILKGK